MHRWMQTSIKCVTCFEFAIFWDFEFAMFWDFEFAMFWDFEFAIFWDLVCNLLRLWICNLLRLWVCNPLRLSLQSSETLSLQSFETEFAMFWDFEVAIFWCFEVAIFWDFEFAIFWDLPSEWIGCGCRCSRRGYRSDWSRRRRCWLSCMSNSSKRSWLPAPPTPPPGYVGPPSRPDIWSRWNNSGRPLCCGRKVVPYRLLSIKMYVEFSRLAFSSVVSLSAAFEIFELAPCLLSHYFHLYNSLSNPLINTTSLAEFGARYSKKFQTATINQ